MRTLSLALVPFALGCQYLGMGNDQSPAKAEKRLAAAEGMLKQRDFAAARKEAATAAELFRRGNPNDARIAAAGAVEGAAALAGGSFADATAAYGKAVAQLDLAKDAPPALRARVLHGQGTALGRAGDLAAAEETLLRAATAIPKDDPDVAFRRDLRRDLAQVQAWMGRRQAAEAALAEALELERERQGVGGDSSELAALHCELGRIKLEAGDLAAAGEAFDQANRVHRALRAAQSADALGGSRATEEESWLAVHAAALTLARGQALHVEPLFEQALRNLAAEYGTNATPRMVSVQRAYAQALLARGKLGPAERAFKTALADCQKLYGPKHPELARTLSAYAEALDANQRGDEAVRCRKRAAEIEATLKTFALST